MPRRLRPTPGVYGPTEIETMISAYRTILQEICDNGFLADISNSALPARELRRLAAKQVVVVAATGIRDRQEMVARALARIASTSAHPD
jgi:hypothetical protein